LLSYWCIFSDVTDNTVKADVHAIIQGIPVPVPWPIDNPDACQSSGLKCPLQPGNNYHYTASFPVKTSYPTVSTATGLDIYILLIKLL
jgi:hypothetical protein